jgi:hypothetical protein
MNRRELMIGGTILAALPKLGLAQSETDTGAASAAPSKQPGSPPTILLNDYLPQSIYKIPITEVPKAKYPVIDCHCHGHGPLSVTEMVTMMDKVGVEKTVVFIEAGTADRFTEMAHDYADHPDRFDLWCEFDLRGVDEGGFGPNAIKSLEECHRAGAKGVGELEDKGRGIFSSGEPTEVLRPANASGAQRPVDEFAGLNGAANFTSDPMPPNLNAPLGPHPDDPRLDALWDKAGQLGMPINIHVSDPIWSYQPMDNSNDGLMNGWSWRIILEPGTYDNNQLVNSLENAVKKHPKTQFIACHLCNLDYDLTRLGQMFDRNSNLYADLGARFAETATIPRVAQKFLTKYSDRIVYGTDVNYNLPFFATTFRILETDDDHFYKRGKVESANFNFNYHWTLNGFGLSDDVLKKIYHENAMRIFARAKQNRA